MSKDGCSDFTPSHIDHGDGYTTLISFQENMRVITIDVLIPEDKLDVFEIGLTDLINRIT